ncbi:MAG: hypothetical protein AAFR73_13250 [Pseudomonadota bacterium]
MKRLDPTTQFQLTARDLLSAGEQLVILEAIEDDPWGGVAVEVDGEEFGGRVRFVQYPLDGDKPSRRGHFVKVTYSVFDQGDRIILMHVGTEAQWERWMRNKAVREAIVAGLRSLFMGV